MERKRQSSAAARVGGARIGINAHLLSGQPGYRRAGIHHYISQLLAHLPQDENLHYTVFSNSRDDVPDGPAFSRSATRWPTGRRTLRILWEQSAWPLEARRRGLDLLHSMAFVTPYWSPCPAVVTVYDLSFIHFPERFPRLQRLYLTGQTGRSCRRARRVVAIAQSGRQDIHHFFQIPLERIDVVSPGVDAHFSPRPAAETAEFRRRQELPEQFVLHVGTLQPRKNIPALIEAMALLNRPEVGLVLVGGRGWLYDEIFDRIGQLGLEKQVRFTGYVPDAELPFWYNTAALLAFPSVYEGFGLPVAQAMACGTPVVAAASSSLPEVAGQAARYFDPQDVPALANHIAAVLDDSQLTAKMRSQGLNQVRHFSWEEAGRQMAAVYQRVLSEL